MDPGRWWRTDRTLAVALAVVGAAEGLALGGSPAVRAGGAVAGALPLVWRRSRPAIAATLTAMPMLVGALVDVDVAEQITPFAAFMIATFSLGLHGSFNELAVGVPATTAVVGASVLAGGKPADLVYVGVLLGLALVPSRLLRARLDQVARLTEQTLRAERESEDRAAAAALEERARIARELHDIIGHGVSLMVVHAAAASAHLDDHETARRSLDAIQDVGRQAVADLARLLGLLREDHAEIGLAPQPGITDLEVLTEAARASGDDVTLTIQGDPRSIPPTVSLTAYRVVQEALTNARRHAPGAHVDAAIVIGPRSVQVEVTNGAGGAAPAMSGTGHGLMGLRERVSMFGGLLESGPRGDGGYAVRAEVPFT